MKLRDQLSFEIPSHGGSRRNAGRKKTRANEPTHQAREEVDERTPIHINFKLLQQVPSLRTPRFMYAFATALANARRFGLRVQQYAIESNHIHLICEVDNLECLKRGMMSLKASIVWALRKTFLYFGRVFVDRYFMHVLKTPTEMKNAIRYVLFNHAKHTGRALFADVYSSVFGFEDPQALAKIRLDAQPPWFSRIHAELSEAQSWMQKVGWRRGR